jgi:hypothetical protein
MEHTACSRHGRTGTPAGHQAHVRAGEAACEPCRTAKSAYLADYSQSNKDWIAEYNRDRRDDRQKILDDLKSVPCADCGGMFPPICMDFDHVRGTKRFSISRSGTRSMQAVREEIEKCEVVCANCHRVRTASRLVLKHPKKVT